MLPCECHSHPVVHCVGRVTLVVWRPRLSVENAFSLHSPGNAVRSVIIILGSRCRTEAQRTHHCTAELGFEACMFHLFCPEPGKCLKPQWGQSGQDLGLSQPMAADVPELGVCLLTLQMGACPPAGGAEPRLSSGFLATALLSLAHKVPPCQSCFLLVSAIGCFNDLVLVLGIEKSTSGSGTCQMRNVPLCQRVSGIRAARAQEMELEWRPGRERVGGECHNHTGGAFT